MKNLFTKIVLMVVLFCFVFSGHLIVSEDETVQLRTAPLNEEFIKYIKDKELGIMMRDFTEDGYPLGLIPSPMDLSHLRSDPEMTIQALPGRFDLRNENKLTKVRHQGQCGCCWAFASTAALESSLLPGERWDFSEQHLIDNHGFVGGPCSGGNIWKALAYYTRWAGPRTEDAFPYIYTTSRKDSSVKKHVQNAVFIPVRSSSTDNSTIKKAVIDYGAVYTNMYFADSCYHPGYASFYNSGIEEGAHAVAIVGWDDNYSRHNFNTVPPGDGAFIVRNSWGGDWGENGYFYGSYYDAFLGKRKIGAVVKKIESDTNYTRIYEYDPSGCTTTIGYDSPTAWFANVFTAKSKGKLKAVSFYVVGSINKYKIWIYNGVSQNQPKSGKIVSAKRGKLKSPGYFTILLKKQVELRKGDRFSIVVRMNSKNSSYPVPSEYHFKDYTKKLKAKNGQSFISWDGKSWLDTHKWIKKTNVCLKGFVE